MPCLQGDGHKNLSRSRLTPAKSWHPQGKPLTPRLRPTCIFPSLHTSWAPDLVCRVALWQKFYRVAHAAWDGCAAAVLLLRTILLSLPLALHLCGHPPLCECCDLRLGNCDSAP